MIDRIELRWGTAQRFEFIEWRVFWLGRVNRIDLEERFGISTPQASTDLRAYQDAAPGRIRYDSTEKAYVPEHGFEPRYLRLSADRYLLQLNAILNGAIATTDTWFGSPPPATVMQTIVRSIDPHILRNILQAIQGRLALNIEYQSLSNTRTRSISPHALALDGHRWHARAWCAHKQEFRDFVLTRVLSVGNPAPSAADPTDDVEWNTMVTMKISPHPSLTASQKSAIERDYEMKNGQLIIQTRAAMAFYFTKRLNLDLTQESIDPARIPLFLSNSDELKAILSAAYAEMKRRVAQKHAS